MVHPSPGLLPYSCAFEVREREGGRGKEREAEREAEREREGGRERKQSGTNKSDYTPLSSCQFE